MEPFLGQIIMFGGNFAPRSWAFCDGQLLSIQQNTALFSILGTTYGGDGRTTFGLPDLRGRVPVHAGNGPGPGLSAWRIGQKGGSETNTLTVQQLPAHNHTGSLKVSNQAGEETDPTGAYLGNTESTELYQSAATGQMAADSVATNNTGGGQPVNNIQPALALNYIICLQGIFPSRS